MGSTYFVRLRRSRSNDSTLLHPISPPAAGAPDRRGRALQGRAVLRAPLGAASMTTVIYGITNPLTLELMYIGKTKHSIDQRLRGHPKAKNNSLLAKWMRSVILDGIAPEIFVIEEI